MDSRLYRELHDSAGDDKALDKVLLREDAAEQLGDRMCESPDWSNIGQNDSQATGVQAEQSL